AACGSGSAYQYVSADVPQDIRYSLYSFSASSTLTIPDTPPNRFPIGQIVVNLAIAHADMTAVDVFLQAPDAIVSLELFSDLGYRTNFHAALADGSNEPVSSYAGSVRAYRPVQALSLLYSRFPMGTWQLHIRDHNPSTPGGTLMSWSLQLCPTQVQYPKTVGVFRPATATFYLRNQNTEGTADLTVPYGDAYDLPIAGDWNADDRDTLGVYRGQTFYLRNANTAGPADEVALYGLIGDLPVVGDWDGYSNPYRTIPLLPLDRDSLGVFRGGGWFLRYSNTSGVSDMALSFGIAGDKPVVGDWNGDGIDTIGVFRNGAWYLRNANAEGPADLSFLYGLAGDLPVVGDWDGDGVDTVGVYRNGTVFLRNTNTSGFADSMFMYGLDGDEPLAGEWNQAP
ncbi:MAG: hypothetical protein KIT87_27695, partial [Anaerolineae bacterium]|nr:hypothetical protein [Anaerolineae bacterium]